MNNLSEEEKKAIESLKKADWFSAILNLIETQQKEIEELRKDKLELINKHHVVHLKDVEKELREMRKEVETKNAEIECLNVIHESYKEMVEENNYISKDKIKALISKLEKEQEDNRKNLYYAIDNLYFSKIDIIADRISVNMSVRDTLQSLLEEE